MSAPIVDPELTSLEQALGAQYEIVRLLGRGGMGVVYLARERLLDRLVAIKVLRREQVDDEARERFLREARTAAKLTHPNIVPLLSFGQSGDTVFYVMGYVDGESLEAYLKREGRMPAEDAARVLTQLADALDYAHRSGVVHRDIKPDNVLIERGTGRAVLTDFGVAKMEHAVGLTKTGMIVGTPHYMSPEQASGDAVDGRSDLYSLGVVGYRMVAGRLPFEATSLPELLAQHASRFPAPLTTHAEVDPVFSSAIARCLEKDPAARWPSAASFGVTLGGISGEMTTLPDGIEHLPSHAVNLIPFLWMFNLGMICSWSATGDPSLLWLCPISVGLFSIVPLPTLGLASRAGIPWRRALRLMFAPPARWSLGWPNSLRRPGDVWSRLPQPVRAFRRMLTIISGVNFFVTVPLVLAMILHKGPTSGTEFRRFIIGLGIAYLPFVWAMWTRHKFVKWAKPLGLTRGARDKLALEPTWGSKFWMRADIAPLLAPAVALPASEVAPRTVGGLVAEIDAAANELARYDDELAREVRAMARETGDLLVKLEQEIDAIANSMNREDVQRMEQMLSIRGDVNDPGLKMMRDLVRQQLDLIKDLEQRQRSLEERHAAGFARLQTLWLQLKTLRAQKALESAEAAEITGRIRALCSNVGHLKSAIDEVNELTRTN